MKRLTFLFLMSIFFLATSHLPDASSKELIKFGVLAPTSGVYSGLGEPMIDGALLAAAIINEEGGLLGREVKMLVRDDETRAATGARMARELHKDQGVNLFLGVVSSGVALALKSVMEEQNTLLITCAAHSTKMTGTEFSRDIFRITDDARTRNYALAALVHEKYPNLKRWANISPDYEYGHSCWDNFIGKLKELDSKVTVVSERWPRFGAGGGYGPHITAILQSNPEGLYTSIGGNDMFAFIREAKQWGLFEKIKLFTASHFNWVTPYTIKKEMVSILTSEHYVDNAYQYPLSKKYEARYKKAYGEERFIYSKGHAAPGFDAVNAYKTAVEKAKSFDVDAIRKALEDLTIDSPLGPKWIRAGDHQAYFDMPYYEIIPDSKSALGWRVGPVTLISGKKYMIPVEEALKQ